jgi:hypothetical protein
VLGVGVLVVGSSWVLRDEQLRERARILRDVGRTLERVEP